MRIIISFLFGALLGSPAVAQKKLKVDVDINGDTMYSTKEQRLFIESGSKGAVAEYLKSTVHKTRNGFMLSLSVQTGRTSVFTIDKGQTAVITLLDGSTVTVSSLSDSRSRASRLGYGCFIYAFYRLTPADIASLKSSGVSSIRINASVGNMDYPIKGKMAGILGEQVGKF